MAEPIRRLLFDALVPKDKLGCPYFYYYYSKFAGNMLVVNSSLNFLVYVLCGRRFRQKVKNLLWCQNNKVGAIDGSTAGGHTLKSET